MYSFFQTLSLIINILYGWSGMTLSQLLIFCMDDQGCGANFYYAGIYFYKYNHQNESFIFTISIIIIIIQISFDMSIPTKVLLAILGLDILSEVLLAILGLDIPSEALRIIQDLHVPSRVFWCKYPHQRLTSYSWFICPLYSFPLLISSSSSSSSPFIFIFINFIIILFLTYFKKTMHNFI